MAKGRRTEISTFQLLVALPDEDVKQLDEIAKQTHAPRVALVRQAVGVFLAERGGKKLAVDLPDDLRADLAALHEAMDGAPVERMVSRALRDYVDSMLRDNDGIRLRFAEARKGISERSNTLNEKVIEFRQTRVS